MRRFAILALAVVLSSSCGGESADKDQLVFAFVPKMRDNPVFNYAKIAAEHRAAELTKKGAKVRIEWRAPTKADQVEQAQIVRSLVGRKVDGIAISCNEAEALREPINEAVAAGIPVVTFDSDSPGSKRTYFFGTDDYYGGGVLAKEISRLLGGKGEVAILSGFSGADNLNRRIRGVEDGLKEHGPGIKVVKKLYCDDDIPKSIQMIASYMEVNPKLGGWIFVGGWPLFGENALNSVDSAKTKVVSFDALRPQWPYLESGKVQALLTQDMWGWGATCVDLLLALKQGKKAEGLGLKVKPDGHVPSPNEVLTPGNLDDYKKRFNNWFPE